MLSVYLDSFAYVKQFSREKGSEVIEKIFDACESKRLIIITSQWTIGESLAAIDRKFRIGEINDQEKEIGMSTLLENIADLSGKNLLTLIPTKPEFVSTSWRFVTERHLSAGDALQLFCATVGLSHILVAADDFLLSAARSEGFETYNIERDAEAKDLLNRLKQP